MPGCAKSGSSTAYPRADSTIDAPFTLTSRVAGQIDTPLCLYTVHRLCAARRAAQQRSNGGQQFVKIVGYQDAVVGASV